MTPFRGILVRMATSIAGSGTTTATDRAAYYRKYFGLPHVRESSGFVLLPLIDSIGAIHMPGTMAKQVLAEMDERGVPGPVVARTKPSERHTFFALADSGRPTDAISPLERYGVSIGSYGSAVILPSRLERLPDAWCWWERRPERSSKLPLVSEVVAAIHTVIDRH